MASEGLWVVPVVEDECYVWRRGELSFAVDPRKGARLTVAALGGHNLLIGPEVNAQNYGSTMWTTPQALWEWPPPRELDEQPYEATVETGLEGDRETAREPGRLVCRGPMSTRLGVSFIKEFWVEQSTGALVMRTTAQNCKRVPTKLGLWEVSRVRTAGLTFFPKGDGIYPPSKLTVEEKNGFIWFAYDPASIDDNQKLFADGSEGWLGHVDGSTLLVKSFPKIPRREQAPGEAEIELYADPGHTYVEVEQQGAYKLLLPHASVSWEVRWSLARLPASVEIAAGSVALADFARALATKR